MTARSEYGEWRRKRGAAVVSLRTHELLHATSTLLVRLQHDADGGVVSTG